MLTAGQLGIRVREAMRPPPPAVPATAAWRDLAAVLVRAPAAEVVLVDASGILAGLIAGADLTRRLAGGTAPDTPLSSLAAKPAALARPDEPLAQAVGRLHRTGARRLLVVDRDVRPAGLLDLADALALLSHPLPDLVGRFVQDGSPTSLQAVKAAQRDLVDMLMAEGGSAPAIQAVLTEINNDLHRRIVEAELEEMAIAGWGAPPVGLTMIIMGSGGRGENYLGPDQDNGFILDDYDDARHNAIDPFFIELAERVTQTLDRVGFPLCRGNVMATNPVWRKTLTQWQRQVNAWLRTRNAITVRLCDIFFDFRPVQGDPARADALRDFVTERLKDNHPFLAAMYENTAGHAVAVDRLGRFVTEKEDLSHRGHINLKYMGTVPLVETVRLAALKAGVAATSTLDRLAGLYDKGEIDFDEFDALQAAFGQITLVLLQRQLADAKAGEAVSNFVDPNTLTRRQRGELTDALAAIRRYRDRVRGDFTAPL
ncbi:MAG: CBS domain-containing protein [Alphaproteobacteria bacterium]|jgi:signal-transduction protein with cAMP-binding, CBS, and nucleotidyltransferase domain|nr:CBS domain-containing protein [Alphaproteobacteria bacterium]